MSPTSAVILEGYNRGNENKANREGSDTNAEAIAIGFAVITDKDSDVRREDRGEGRSSEESKGRGEFHFEN